MNRRQSTTLLWLVAATVGVLPGLARAQARLTDIGVFSLLGDSVQVTGATDAPTDTRLERTARESMDFKGMGFDLLALRAARAAVLRVQPQARVVAFAAPAALSVAEQREVAAGALKAELPAWMVKTLEANRLSHLLLVTRSRGALDARTADGDAIGRGTVDGIGFYMDTLYTMRNTRTGAVSTGLLAPYTQIRLTLMDAQSGDILATYEIKESFAHASPESQVQAEPWNFMPAADKVRTLRDMVTRGMDRGLAQLLGTR